MEISNKLIRGFHWLSPHVNDMPPNTSYIVLREIDRELERRQIMGVEIKEIAKKVKDLEEHAPAETPRTKGTFTIMRAIKEGRRYSRVEGKWYYDKPEGE
jgi:hypothetical protein